MVGMTVASETSNLIFDHVQDHPWPGCTVEVLGVKVTWMSSGIASMLLVAAVLIPTLLLLARRWRATPRGGANVLDVIVVFVRDMIARPALGDKAYRYLPLLLTMFVFVLGMNLVGILPLGIVTESLHVPPVGATPTAILTVCAALAGVTLLAIVAMGFRKATLHFAHKTGWPVWAAALLAPLLWVKGLAPKVPGAAGVVLGVPLALLELVGVAAKCFSLMIRLFANMIAGHALLAVMMMLIVMSLQKAVVNAFYVGPFVIAASVAVDLMELMVAGLQAYIFTFLSAMFLGLYVESEH
ncbi:MAG TPA: F0F1 ATP synthase subunit A [Phycisphaerae bacterium]|nr:F0F1 ATP synthase subunit A [Phycisphaerae bacterium]